MDNHRLLRLARFLETEVPEDRFDMEAWALGAGADIDNEEVDILWLYAWY